MALKEFFFRLMQDVRSRQILLFTLSGILIVGLIVYSYIYFQEKTEEKVSIEINELMNKQIELKQEKTTAEDLSTYDQGLRELEASFFKVYEENAGLSSGLRALLLSAHIDYELSQYEEAEKKYQTLLDQDASHYLAPVAYFHIVLINESAGNHAKVIELAEQFQILYSNHFLTGEILLALARNYYFSDQTLEADRIFQEILQNESMGSFYESVQEWLNLLKIEKKLKQEFGTETN